MNKIKETLDSIKESADIEIDKIKSKLFVENKEVNKNLTPEQQAFIGKSGGQQFNAPLEIRSKLGVTSQVPLGQPNVGVYTSPQQRAAFEALSKLKGGTYTAPAEQYVGSPEQSFSHPDLAGNMSIPEYIKYIQRVRAEEAAKYNTTPDPSSTGGLPNNNTYTSGIRGQTRMR